jgi:hypothetical protein
MTAYQSTARVGHVIDQHRNHPLNLAHQRHAIHLVRVFSKSEV